MLGSFPTYTWVVLYFPILIFSLASLVYLLWRNSTSKHKKAVFLALLILGAAIFLDIMDGFVAKNSSLVFCLKPTCHSIVLHLMRLTEEVMEVLALGILGYTNIQEHCLKKDEA